MHVNSVGILTHRWLKSEAAFVLPGATQATPLAVFASGFGDMATLILDHWTPGFNKIALTKLLHSRGHISLSQAKQHVDNFASGRVVSIYFPNISDAEVLAQAARAIGAVVEVNERDKNDIVTAIAVIEQPRRLPQSAFDHGETSYGDFADLVKQLERKWMSLKDLSAKRYPSIVDWRSSSVERTSRYGQLDGLIPQYPRGAIIEAWLMIDDEVRRAARAHGVVARPNDSTIKLVRNLSELQVVPTGLASVVAYMSRVRNAAVHVKEFVGDRQIAKEYVDMARRVVDVARSVALTVRNAA